LVVCIFIFTDDGLEVCIGLAEKYEKVRLFRHPGGKNLGAPASFNLGMKKATSEYLTILGADDYYLPGRFEVAKEIFESDPECDGVYEALGKFYQDIKSEKRWQAAGMLMNDLSTVKIYIEPDNLLELLVRGGNGHFSLDSFVMRRKLLINTGFMNEKLLLHQDTEFILRAAYIGKLIPGRIDEPVAIRRIHQKNRISSKRTPKTIYHDKLKMWIESYKWFKKNAAKEKINIIVHGLVSWAMKKRHFNICKRKFLKSEIFRRWRLILLFCEFPSIIIEPHYWIRYLPLRLQKKLK